MGLFAESAYHHILKKRDESDYAKIHSVLITIGIGVVGLLLTVLSIPVQSSLASTISALIFSFALILGIFLLFRSSDVDE
jgi:hypothetical protein